MNSEKKVLIFQGGWDGHEPALVAARFADIMRKHGYSCEVHSNQEILLDEAHLMEMDLIVPCWTMGSIDPKARENISKAVAAGCGLAGCHGGMCDAFRDDTEWQFMTGGQWVSHPGWTGICLPLTYWFGVQSAQFMGMLIIVPLFYLIKYFEDGSGLSAMVGSLSSYLLLTGIVTLLFFCISLGISVVGYARRK